MKKLIVFFIVLCVLSSVSAQKIGEKVYKEFSINGELVGKWCEYMFLSEFDEFGRKTHTKGQFADTTYSYDENGNLISDSDGDVYKYDSHGNMIYFKNPSRGFEIYYEYDSKGNMIHYSRTDGIETWCEYDSHNNKIHEKVSNGNEIWYEYDKKGNKTYENGGNGNETFYKYDHMGNLIYRKTTQVKTTWEDWYQYDKKGKVIYKKQLTDGKNLKETKYLYDDLGNELYRFYTTSQGFYSVDFHELEYWDAAKSKIKSDKEFRYIK